MDHGQILIHPDSCHSWVGLPPGADRHLKQRPGGRAKPFHLRCRSWKVLEASSQQYAVTKPAKYGHFLVLRLALELCWYFWRVLELNFDIPTTRPSVSYKTICSALSYLHP